MLAVVEPGYFELDSITQLNRTLAEVQELYHPELDLLGNLFTKADSTVNSRTSPVNGLLMSRAFAVQGNCFVIAVGSLIRPDDVLEIHRDLVRARESTKPDQGGSGSCIISPSGNVIAAAPANKKTFLTVSVSLETVLQHNAVNDIGGHYSRPDILQLQIDRRPLDQLVDRSL